MAVSARIRANKIHLASYIGKGIVTPGAGGGVFRRATGSGMRLDIQGATSNAQATINRIRMVERVDLAGELEFAIGIYRLLFSSSAGETDWPHALKFQIAINPIVYEEKTSGLNVASRVQAVADDGTLIGKYNGPGTCPTGHVIMKATLPPGVVIPKGQPFELVVSVDGPQGGTNNVIPFTETPANYIPRFEGWAFKPLNTATNYCDTNDVMTKASFTAHAATQGGSNGTYTPVAIRQVMPKSQPVVMLGGSSDQYGVGEGNSWSGTNASPPVYGDTVGTLNRAHGWAARMCDRFGYPWINVAKGGDGAKNTRNPANTVYRDWLLTWANPSHWVEDGDHNSYGSAVAASSFVAGATVTAYQAFAASGGCYMFTEDGTAGAAEPAVGNTSYSTVYRDGSGTAAYRYIGPNADATDRSAATLFSFRAKRRARVRSLVPGIRILANLKVQASTSTDLWQTVAGQADTTQSSELRRRLMALDQRAGQDPIFGCDFYLKPYAATEDGVAGITNRWAQPPLAIDRFFTTDGVHSTSTGYSFAAAGIPVDPVAATPIPA